MMYSKPSRFITRTLCGLVIVLAAYAPTPYTAPRAHAIFGDIALATKEYTLDGIAWLVADVAWQSMTQSIVNWINSGFEGSPAFITDLNRELSGVADAVAEDFFRGLDSVVVSNTGFSIRAPFQDQISAALREEFYRTTSSYGFDVRHPYNDCNRSAGFSFDSWFCQSQNPANNPYGRYMLARDDLWRAVNQETQNRLREAGWAGGFKGWRGNCGPYGNGNQTAGPGGVAGPVDLNQRDQTVGCSIRTPGAVIEDQLVNALGAPFARLTAADEINEIIGALLTQMVNQVLGSGGLTGVSQPSAGGGRSYINQATTVSASSGVFSRIGTVRADFVEYRTSWQRIASAASSAQNACSGNDAQKAAQVLTFANARVTETNTFISRLESIQSSVTMLQSKSSTTNDEILVLANEYNNVLAGSGEVARGPDEATDTGDIEPSSLYSQMVRLQRSCR